MYVLITDTTFAFPSQQGDPLTRVSIYSEALLWSQRRFRLVKGSSKHRDVAVLRMVMNVVTQGTNNAVDPILIRRGSRGIGQNVAYHGGHQVASGVSLTG